MLLCSSVRGNEDDGERRPYYTRRKADDLINSRRHDLEVNERARKETCDEMSRPKARQNRAPHVRRSGGKGGHIMRPYQKSVSKRNEEERQTLERQYKVTHHFKKEDHQHETQHGIGYSEYQCLKLGGYRADDRPYGNAGDKKWRIHKKGQTMFDVKETLSKETAKTWIAQGLEVWAYDQKGNLKTVHNASKNTLYEFNKMRVTGVKFA